MRILLTNDDGYAAPGLRAVRDELRRLGDVTVCAPEREQSGVSSSLTLYRPLMLRELRGEPVPTTVIDGRPADVVKLALTEVLAEPPHVVVSGINFGLNCGPNILYSGTLAAALEAAQAGHTAVALSLQASPEPEWKVVAKLAVDIVAKIVDAYPQSATVFNVNIPARPVAKMKGVRVTRQDPTPWKDSFDRRTDPRGRTYFWLRGGMPKSKRSIPGEMMTDSRATHEGYISVTPIHRDLTADDLLEPLKKQVENHERRVR